MTVPNLFSPKTPSDVLDYSYDFTKVLGVGETIVSASVTASPNDLVCSSAIVVGAVVSSFLSGGTAETSYDVKFTITTNVGNTETRSAILNVYAIV